MTDDDLIRDAVHELVAAAPPPKPLTGHDSPSPRSYRWLAVAAAAILIVGGIVAIAWTGAGDDEEQPAATTPTQPVPTSTPVVTPPGSTTPDASAPPQTTVPATDSSAAPTTTTTTTAAPTTTTVAPTTTLAPATPEQANLVAYLNALAEGRYDDPAALTLNEGGLEPERRAGMRPLFDEFGDVDDLPARLRSWCEGIAVCTQPDGAPFDVGGFYWAATWNTPDGALTAYFRSSSFEGAPSVSGLPPRRASGPIVACPTSGVELVREAELDADGVPETIVVTRTDSALLVNVCNTSLSVPPMELPLTETPVAGVIQPASATDATLLLGESGETGVCAATYRMAASAGALVGVGWDGCWGVDATESIGCRDIGGQSQIVGYEYSFVGGSGLNDSTAMDVDVVGFDGAPLESFTLSLPDQIDEALQIIEPYCNRLPIVTEG